jgi:HEAT repeat protein
MRRPLQVLVLLLLVPTLALAQTSDRQKVVDRLAKDLKSRNVDTRVEAAESLGRLEFPEAVEPLVTALSDRDARVRREAASGLWNSSDVAKEAIPALRTALEDPEPSVVIRAAGALISMDVSPKSIAAPLRNVLQNGDDVDRFLAARALIGIEPGATLVAPILDYLRRNAPDPKSEDWSGRHDNFEAGEKALKRLAETQERGIAVPLVNNLQSSQYLTEPILVALGVLRDRPERWVDTLLNQLSSLNPDVREKAIELLGDQKSPADTKLWVRPVARMLTDSKKNVRDEAIRSLKDVGGLALDAVTPLTQVVSSDKEAELRGDAAEAIGEIADAGYAVDTAIKVAAAKVALPVLQNALNKDADKGVRDKALRAINHLDLDSATVAGILADAAINQKESNLRTAALQALRNRGKEVAMVEDRIAPLKNDADEWVRKMAEATIESMHSAHMSMRPVTTAAAVDPAAKEKALETLRDYHYQFTEEQYLSALMDVEVDIVRAFLDAGMSADHHFGNSYGNPALRTVLESAEACSPDVRPSSADGKALIKLLLARGADANGADENGNTPLMTAAQNCDAEVVKILVNAKAKLGTKNGSGMTAFEFGLWNATDGAAAIAAAGFRLPDDKVKMYAEAYKKEPKKLALLAKATKTAAAKPAAKK